MTERHRFILFGAASGAMVALATVALMWGAIFVVTGSNTVFFTPANIVLPGFIGVITYPACWLCCVGLARDYSAGRTAVLVLVTYVASCLLAAIGFTAWTIHTMSAAQLRIMPDYGVRLVLLGAILLALPYAAVATPMAFLHRRMLLRRG